MQLGSALLNRIQRLGIVLNDICIHLSPYTLLEVSVHAFRSFLNNLSAVTRQFRIVVQSLPRNDGTLLFAIRNVTFLANITELHLFVRPTTRQEAENVSHILSHLGKLSCLKKFACGNWKSYDVTAALSNGLMFCLVLQELEIRDISASVREELGLLVSRIPSNIQSLYLRSLEVTDVDMIDLCTRLSNLCGLRLARLPKVSSRGIHQSLTKLPRLQVLKCSVPISAVLLSLRGILIITVICSLNISLLFIVRGIIPIDGGLISKSKDGNCDSLAGLHFVIKYYVPFRCGFR
ncbi:hypothetical protein GCK32_006241 [Trichostrongylus colubriformis]|uniref:Uncharacterized protein n=1 Tax=Trichostrongylus colubriformis TaxID=6319 RepID=A0AAN8FS64_TRICO